MSTRKLLWVKAAGALGWRPYHLHSAEIRENPKALTSRVPKGLLRPVAANLYLLHFLHKCTKSNFVNKLCSTVPSTRRKLWGRSWIWKQSANFSYQLFQRDKEIEIEKLYVDRDNNSEVRTMPSSLITLTFQDTCLDTADICICDIYKRCTSFVNIKELLCLPTKTKPFGYPAGWQST
jgi:hypothetical protein